MATVKTVKIDGQMLHIFQSVIYIFESNIGKSLELDMIVSEVVVNKYKNEETLIIEIELSDGRIIGSIMNVKILSGKLPQMSVFMEVDDVEEYRDLLQVNENDIIFPTIGDGITLEEIRRVEMPHEKISLKLNLPINQVEWLKSHKGKELNDLFEILIDDYLKKKSNFPLTGKTNHTKN